MMSESYFQKRNRVRIGDQPFFVNFNNSTKHPREESFTEMIYISCFPRLTIKSITFIIFLMDVAMYIGCFYYAGMSKEGSLFTPNQRALFDFGMKYPYYMRYDFQIQRFIGCMFLFANLQHMLVSTASLLVFGSYVEALIGFKKTFLLYIISGYGGTLLSCLMSDAPSVQGSNTPAAFLGVLLGFLLIKWEKWDYPGSGRLQMLCILIFGMISTFAAAYMFPQADSLSMAGSFVIGLLFIFGVFKEEEDSVLIPYHLQKSSSLRRRNPASSSTYQSRLYSNQENENNKCSRFLTIGLIFFYIAGGTVAFFFMRTPKII